MIDVRVTWTVIAGRRVHVAVVVLSLRRWQRGAPRWLARTTVAGATVAGIFVEKDAKVFVKEEM